jgi:hypothetical protein
MGTLDAVVQEAGICERLLVATEAGRTLYQRLGWRVLAPYSTAVLLLRPPAGTTQPRGRRGPWLAETSNGLLTELLL